jgi:putative queuosine salvage protein
MAYEELPPPAFILPFPLDLDRAGIVDFVLTATCINFAFTNFQTRVRWEVVHDGRTLADADGMHFCLQRALAEGVPVLDGAWLSQVEEEQLRGVFRGGSCSTSVRESGARSAPCWSSATTAASRTSSTRPGRAPSSSTS